MEKEKKGIYSESFFVRRKKNLPKAVVKSTIDEILVWAKEMLAKPTSELLVLDVGAGTGEYSFELEKCVKKVVAVEPFKDAYIAAVRKKKKLSSKVLLYNSLIEDFDYPEKFDLVASLTTFEHMAKQEKSFMRIFSLMKKEGIIYLTAPNRLWPFEYHYRLPFLSWLPLPLSNLYLRLTKRGISYENSAYSRTYFGMRKFFDKFSCRYEFVLPKDLGVAYLGCGEGGGLYHFLKRVGIRLIKNFPFFWAFSKGFIIIIKKI